MYKMKRKSVRALVPLCTVCMSAKIKKQRKENITVTSAAVHVVRDLEHYSGLQFQSDDYTTGSCVRE